MIYSANAIIFNLESYSYKSSTIGLSDDKQDYILTGSRLKKVFPNPFSELLSIYFEINNSDQQYSDVKISIYNSAGQLVRILTDIPMRNGEYIVQWDGKLDGGSQAKDYAYFVHFQVDDHSVIKKVILQRQN